MVATLMRLDRRPVLWRELPGLTPYALAVAAMHQTRDAIEAGEGREEIRLIMSPAGFNRGSDRADPPSVPGVPIEDVPGPGRAGGWTYTGPGVRGVIVLLDLRARRKAPADLVAMLHDWIIATLAELGVAGAVRDPALCPAGVWIGGKMIAPIGLRLTRWITSYGLALYLDPDLEHDLAGFRPCGVAGAEATSIARELPGAAPPLAVIDATLRRHFENRFGPTSTV